MLLNCKVVAAVLECGLNCVCDVGVVSVDNCNCVSVSFSKILGLNCLVWFVIVVWLLIESNVLFASSLSVGLHVFGISGSGSGNGKLIK